MIETKHSKCSMYSVVYEEFTRTVQDRDQLWIIKRHAKILPEQS